MEYVIEWSGTHTMSTRGVEFVIEWSGTHTMSTRWVELLLNEVGLILCPLEEWSSLLNEVGLILCPLEEWSYWMKWDSYYIHSRVSAKELLQPKSYLSQTGVSCPPVHAESGSRNVRLQVLLSRCVGGSLDAPAVLNLRTPQVRRFQRSRRGKPPTRQLREVLNEAAEGNPEWGSRAKPSTRQLREALNEAAEGSPQRGSWENPSKIKLRETPQQGDATTEVSSIDITSQSYDISWAVRARQ